MMAPLRAAWPHWSRGTRASWTFAAVLALGLAAPPALAAPVGTEELELSWIAPRGCADAASLRQDVARVLGESGKAHRKLRAHGEVHQTEPRTWSVTLSLDTDGGHALRTLTAQTCQALARAAAVVIAFTMTSDDAGESTPSVDDPPSVHDPAATQPPRPPIDLPPSRAEDLATPSSPPPTASPPRSSSPTRPGPTVGVLVRADAGTLPRVALGPGVVVGWYERWVFLEASVGTLSSQTQTVVPPAGQKATISTATFDAFYVKSAICPQTPALSLDGPSVRLFGCTGVGLLQMQATSREPGRRGEEGDGPTTETWSGNVFLGPRLRIVRGWFALSASADVTIPFRRPEFNLTDPRGAVQIVHRTAAAIVGAGITAELSFFQ